MKRDSKEAPYIYHSISELHRALGVAPPLHPLVSLVNYKDIKNIPPGFYTSMVLDFYKISFKKSLAGKIRYGQNYYDFDDGGLVFISPLQPMSSAGDDQVHEGYSLLIHPDFIRGYPLGTSIKKFGFFSYGANEALHLSEKEKSTIDSVFANIRGELSSTIDDFSQDVMVSQIEVLLHYSNRFYKRQFITRKSVNSDLLEKLESLLNNYFNDETAVNRGLPTVQYLSDELHVSPGYLSDMLRSLTGQNAQQHIHNKLIEKAKEMLSASSLSVAEVAYHLGFGHPQSFNKIFKRKTNLTPIEFKQSFN